MDFIKATDLNFCPRKQLSHIFVEGFYEWLKYFKKDKDMLKEVFRHVFLLEYFYVALEKGEKIAATTACTSGFSPIALERAEFVRVLGFWRGSFMYFMLRRQMVRNSYPFTLSKSTGTLEFVATEPEYRHQGVAYALLSHIMEAESYDAYVLEVADTNKNARLLYEKLGFVEIKSVKAPRGSGVGDFLYMRKTKDSIE